MNTRGFFLTIISLIALGLLGCAAEPVVGSGDSPSLADRPDERPTAISARLVRVEEVLHRGEELRLETGQREEIEEQVRRAAPLIEAAADVVRTRTAALAAMLDAVDPDLTRMIDAGHALAEAEAELKARHLELLLRVHASLSNEQRERLRHHHRSSGALD